MGELKNTDKYPTLSQVFVGCHKDDNIPHGRIGAFTYPIGQLEEVITQAPESAQYFTHDQLYAFAHEDNFVELDRSRKIMTRLADNPNVTPEQQSAAREQLAQYDLLERDIAFAAQLLANGQFNTHNNEVKSLDHVEQTLVIG